MAAMEKNPERQVMAGWVRSPMAASEQSSSLNPGMADWLQSGNCYGRNGHPAAGMLGNLNGSKPAKS
jgi:hypothetical protein